MPQSLRTAQEGLEDDLKGYSCLTCRQRKVKCDRHNPCSNCVKAETQCSFIAPVRGKRKKLKLAKEGLHAKLKRYEDLLKSYGVEIDPSEHYGDSDLETVSQPDIATPEDCTLRRDSHHQHFESDQTEPKLISKEGTSRYFDNALWSNLNNDFQHPEVGDSAGLVDGLSEDESGLLFDSETNHRFDNLANLHPSPQVLSKLKEIYIDRIDPLVKIIHLPTFWIALTSGLRQPQDLPKSLEAVIFAFCLVTILTMEENECQSLFGVQKSVVFPRYKLATRQALVNAGFLSTFSPTTLTAYAIYMLCIRKSYRCDVLYLLSGIGIRLGRKMGLHRDGMSLGLNPFETEMRRRLWWHLVHMDFRMAEVLGGRPSLDLFNGDVKMPLNVNDEDLSPDMLDTPPDRNGITSVTLTLIKCEIGMVLGKLSSEGPGDVRWETLYDPGITPAKKDSIISQIEDHLESKYLRYCDLSDPLHTFVSVTVRSGICKMKLYAHSPRQYANSSTKTPQSERDIVFANATKLLEYIIVMQGGHHGMAKYMWHMGTSYLWNTMLYVLIELRHRNQGPDVDRTWQLIGQVYSHYPKVFERSPGAVYVALGRWTIEVWDDYIASVQAKGLAEPTTPEYIHSLRRCRGAALPVPSTAKDQATDPGLINPCFSGYDSTQTQKLEGDVSDPNSFTSYDFPNLLSFEMDPNEWTQWEQLVAGQSGFTQVDNMRYF